MLYAQQIGLPLKRAQKGYWAALPRSTGAPNLPTWGCPGGWPVRAAGFRPRHHVAPGPLRRPTNLHVVDEAHFSTGPLSELDQVSEFIFVGAAHHDGVYLQRPKTCLTGSLDPAEHRCVGVPSS